MRNNIVMNSAKAQFWRVNMMVWVLFAFVVGDVIVRQIENTGPDPKVVYPLLFIGFLTVAARTYIGSRRPEDVFTFTPLLTGLDIFIISLAVYVTGRRDSPFWLLYFPLLVSEVFTASPRQIVSMIGLVGILHTLSSLPLRNPADYGALFTRLFFLLVVAGIARSVSKAHLQRVRELARLRERVTLADERQRIAREFHDGLGHTLVNSVLGLELVRRLANRDPEKADTMLGEQATTLREALESMRYVVWQMQSSSETRSLETQIRLFAKQLEERASLQVTCELPNDPMDLAPSVEVMLARVVQESLTNIAKHAKNATKVSIGLTHHSDRIEAVIEDDGQGFDPSKVIGGSGLQHMKERIETLGGQFEIVSTPSKGTCIRLSVPTDDANKVQEKH
jgi:signal transduction histidine kinase